MAPKTPQSGEKHDALRSGSASSTHRAPGLNPGDKQTAQTAPPAANLLWSRDWYPISSASCAPLAPSKAPSQKTWLSRPFLPDRAEVEKLLIKISSSDTRFVKQLHWSKASDIWLVEHKGQKCVLKVFHENQDYGLADDGRRDLDRYRCEARAYVNLKKSGLCDRGIVPKVYGFIECLDPHMFEDELHNFQCDQHYPNAILLEYLPGVSSMDYLKYSKERMNIAIEGIRQIHELAFVEHMDTYTKNILIAPGPPERVLWADFDIAASFKDESVLTTQDKANMDLELEVVKSLGDLLAEDQKLGRALRSRGF